jgi:two-component system, cell cycle sensor histidine kinase and response regulator CckA
MSPEDHTHTEHKGVDPASQESEAKYRLLVDHCSDLIWNLSAEGVFLDLSPSWARVTGYEPSSLIGTSFVPLVHPDDVGACFEYLHRIVDSKQVLQSPEYRVRHADGTWHWHRATSTPVIGPNGEYVSMVGLSRDITELKQADAALRVSEAKFREIFETIEDLYYETDSEGIITLLSPSVHRLTGWNEEDLIGKPAAMMYVDPNQKERLLGKLSEEGYVHDYELLLRRKDGGERHASLSARMIVDDDGRPAGVRGLLRDITDRKRAQNGLEESERKFRDLSEKSFVGIYLIQDDIFKYVNARFAEIHGYMVEEIINNKGPADFALPEDIPTVTENMRKRVSGEVESLHYDFRAITKNGEIRNVEIFGSRTVYQGKPAVIGTLVDVSERKGTEEALKESESRFRALAENSPAAIFVIQGAKYMYINPAFTRMTGYTFEDLSVMNFWDFIHPDMRDLIKERGMARQRQEDVPHWYELKFVTKSGQVGFGDFGAALIDFQGKPAILGSVFDITERRRAEEALRESERKFRDMAEKSVAGIYLVQDGVFKYANPKFAEIFGYEVEEISGIMRAEEAIFPEDWPMVEENLRKRLSGELTSLHYEFRIVTRNKEVRNAEIYSSLTIYQGKPAVIGTFLDITERKNLGAQLLQSQKMEAIGTLAGGIAHDFNNLLMGIQGYASLILLELDAYHPHYERLKRIEDLVQSAADLTGQLLGFARGGRYETRPVDINEIVRKTSSMFGRTKKELTIHERYEEELRVVEADQGQIEQVLLNLYVNAWHAMPSGGDLYLETGNVALDERYAALHATPSGDYVRISVTDTGMGMDEKTRKRIFDPFFTTKDMGRGTGLGLAIVYGIMKGHSGFVNVYSEPGHGTTFNLYLPSSEQEASRERPAVPEILMGSETILLVDDEPNVLAVSTKILESLGYTVHGMRSGQEAIAFYEEKKNDIALIILDMIMPGLSGSETFDRLRALNPTAKIILSSGYSLNGQAQEIMNKGCHGFIQKPFDRTRISRKVREVAEKQEA